MGKDRRKRVASSKLGQSPYNAVALLKIEFPNRTFYASGFFLDKTTVVTTGHCIYSNSEGGVADKITYNSTGTEYAASSFTYNPAWNGGPGTNDKDYGVVKISSEESSFFETDFTCDVRNRTLHCTGFPDNNTVMYTAFSKAQTNGSTQFKHSIDTTGGQSGSPVYYNSNGSSYVVGIHTGGETDQYNVAVRFNSKVRDWCLNA